MLKSAFLTTASATAVLTVMVAAPVQAQTVLTLSDGVVENSLCVGGDCGTGI